MAEDQEQATTKLREECGLILAEFMKGILRRGDSLGIDTKQSFGCMVGTSLSIATRLCIGGVIDRDKFLELCAISFDEETKTLAAESDDDAMAKGTA